MTRSEQHLLRSRRRSAAARARLTGSLVELQTRLRPAALLEGAVEDLCEKAEEMADEAIALVKERPVYAAGVVLAIVAYVFRAPLWRLIADKFSKDQATDPGDDVFEDESGTPSVRATTEERA